MAIFVTGIDTNVGKTIASAIITEALEADYWKPIQSGDLEHSDSHKIKELLSNEKTKIHSNAYAFRTPASPHFSAAVENIKIDIGQILRPKTENTLVIEGAGGVLVPLNEQNLLIDIIQPTDQIIVVSKNYLGSINHTLLTIEALKVRNLSIAGIIFNGPKNEATEEIILKYSGLNCLGFIEEEPYFDANVVKYYADLFREILIEKLFQV